MNALFLLLLAFPAAARAVSPSSGTAFLEQYAATYRFSLGRPSGVRVTPDGKSVLFLRTGPRTFVRDLYAWDAEKGEERVLLTAERILKGAEERLSAEELARRERMRSAARGIASFDLSRDGKRLLIPLSNRLFVIENEQVRELTGAAGSILDPRFSPDGTRVAYARDNELYAVSVDSPTERRLTIDASSTVSNALAEFIAQEEMGRYEGYWWSPDGKTLAYEQADTAGLERFHIADLKRPEQEPGVWPYPRAGKTNARVRLGLIPAEGGDTVWVDWDRERFPYLAKVVWEKDAPLTILVQDRRQQEQRLLAVDPSNGKVKTLLEEKDAAWLNLDESVPRWLPGGKAFLWSSERSGDWRLELRRRDGSLERTLTEAELGYHELLGVDAAGREAFVAASPDPTQSHLYRVPLSGRAATRLTHREGVHYPVFPREGASAFVVSSSELDGSRRQTVHRADGSELGELRSVAEEPGVKPRLEFTSVGKRGLRAWIARPSDFDPSRRYPVIVYVYGGPTSNTVRASASWRLLDQWFADHGFIVVGLDGRGTLHRGREWERSIRGNFIRVALEDQVEGLKALGAKYKEMDLSRVGIYGWSFGGYFSALAAMLRPDVYHAAVAGAPVADWRDYDTHYTERYLGLPEENEAGYADSSVLTHAPALTRPLLLIHGTTDDNVYFMHSLKMSDALFRAGKRHEFVPLVGYTHMVPDPVVTTRLYSAILDFFRRSLAQR